MPDSLVSGDPWLIAQFADRMCHVSFSAILLIWVVIMINKHNVKPRRRCSSCPSAHHCALARPTQDKFLREPKRGPMEPRHYILQQYIHGTTG